jgi:glycosyltransferase involved in cell wall biosynthesis
MKSLLGELNRGTISAGYKTYGICSSGENWHDIEKDGVELIEVEIKRSVSLSHIKAIIQMYKALKSINPDIVHVHTPVAALLGRIAAKMARVPNIVYTAHGFYFHENMHPLLYCLIYWIEKIMAKFFTDIIFTQSEEDAKTAIEGKFLSENRIVCISNGVDVEGKFNPANINIEEINEIRKSLGISEDKIVVSFVGRIVKEKGILDLLEAFTQINKSNVKLLIIGSKYQGDRDRDTISRLKIYESHPNIVFTGKRDDIHNLLYISDIFCLPSYREGMPRSIIEAMAMENAIIATNIRGSREEVINGYNGFLVPLADPASIRDKLEVLLENKELRDSMRKHSRLRAEDLYNEKKVVKKQIDIFSQLVKCK